MLNRNSRERKSPLRTVLHKRPRANGARASLEWQVLFLFILFFLPALSTAAQTNVLTYHNDSARTGQNLNETLLTLSNVNATNFGKLGSLSVDGQVDAQPLYVANLTVAGSLHNVVFIVTEHDSVYAFDADTFAQLWKVTVLGSGETASDNRGCDQVSPEIGITSTPGHMGPSSSWPCRRTTSEIITSACMRWTSRLALSYPGARRRSKPTFPT